MSAITVLMSPAALTTTLIIRSICDAHTTGHSVR